MMGPALPVHFEAAQECPSEWNAPRYACNQTAASLLSAGP